MGLREEALDALERAYRERDFMLYIVVADPAFRPLAREPRFRALLERMGLRP